jgi:hypothetical protein
VNKNYLKENPKYPIIIDALITWHKWNFETSREEYRKNQTKVNNPYFWEYGELVEYIGVNKGGLIWYTQKQPGTNSGDEYHIIGVTIWYEEYRPFHDRWMLAKQRNDRIDSILNE